MRDPNEERVRRRFAVVFGWITGGALGFVLSSLLFLWLGESYPAGIATFLLFVVGALSGTYFADRLGAYGFRALGIAAGVVLSLAITTALAIGLFGR